MPCDTKALLPVLRRRQPAARAAATRCPGVEDALMPSGGELKASTVIIILHCITLHYILYYMIIYYIILYYVTLYHIISYQI